MRFFGGPIQKKMELPTWIGHAIRMEDGRLREQLLYGDLVKGVRSAEDQNKGHNDHTKTILKKCNINNCMSDY